MREADVRLRGPHLIGQANLNTSVSGQSGSMVAASAVLVNLSAYTLVFASLTTLPIVRIPFWGPWFSFGTPTPDADAPQWLLFNDDNQTKLYGVEWRHINP